jgi:isochorismate hydrolase
MRKEAYFTLETLALKSKTLLGSVIDLRRRHDRLPEPGKAALLVLDLQGYFLDETSHAYVPSASAILPGICRLVAAWSACQFPLVFTRHLNTPEDARGMVVWWQDLIREGSPLSAITADLDTEAGVVFEKSQYDAFYGTPLEDHLRFRDVTQVIICGVMTHLCCESTARSAFMRGFEVFFTVDGTATYTEAFHRATLLNLAHGFAIPVLLEEVRLAVQPYEA